MVNSVVKGEVTLREHFIVSVTGTLNFLGATVMGRGGRMTLWPAWARLLPSVRKIETRI